MEVLSLFDGISCGRVALDRAGINVKTYYASEIDKYATKISEENYPDIVRLGNVTNWENWNVDWSSFDLVLAGFPCQSWSIAGQQQGDKDPRGALFWITLDIISHVLKSNPSAKFMMENVKMKKEFEEYITHHTEEALGYVEKTLINSALVSAQNRNRFYWTNFKVSQPTDKGILLRDMLEEIDGDRPCKLLEKETLGGHREPKVLVARATVQKNAEHCYNGKCPTLTASMGMGGGYVPLLSDEKIAEMFKGKYINAEDRALYRKLTPLECERLQTLPDNYTNHVSNTQRYKAIGNGWTVDVIAHIFKEMLCQK